MMRKRTIKTPDTRESVEDKIADQTFWVNQVKNHPEDFEQYLNKKVLRRPAQKEMFNSTNVYTVTCAGKKNRCHSAYPSKSRRPTTGKLSLIGFRAYATNFYRYKVTKAKIINY